MNINVITPTTRTLQRRKIMAYEYLYWIFGLSGWLSFWVSMWYYNKKDYPEYKNNSSDNSDTKEDDKHEQ